MSDALSPSAGAPADPALLALLQAGQARRSRRRAAAPSAIGEPSPSALEPVSPAASLAAAAEPVAPAASAPPAAIGDAARPSAPQLAKAPFFAAEPFAPAPVETHRALGVSALRAPAAPAFAEPERAEPSFFAQNPSPAAVAASPEAIASAPAPVSEAVEAPSAPQSSAAARLAQAQLQAQGPGAKTAFVGSRPAAQRSIWRHLRWAAGASAFVATLALAAGAFVHSQTAVSAAKAAPQPAAQASGASASWQKAGVATPVAPVAQQAAPAAARDKNFLAPMGYGSAVIPQPAAPALLALPIAIDDANPLSEHELAVALLPKDPFLALAVTVERLRTKSYYDVAGANIGMGYCLPMRLAEYGKERVTRDFEQAGMSPEQIKNMLSGNRKKVLSVEITQSQALRLLMITKSDYSQLARNAVGSKVFDSLAPDRKTALTYLAYNSNIGQFSQLVSAVSRGRDLLAMEEMIPSFRMSSDAPLQKNYRLGSYLWAAWTGTLSDAIANPMRHEGLYANESGLSSFQRAYGLTQKHGAMGKAKFAVPVSPASLSEAAMSAQTPSATPAAAVAAALPATTALPPSATPASVQAQLAAKPIVLPPPLAAKAPAPSEGELSPAENAAREAAKAGPVANAPAVSAAKPAASAGPVLPPAPAAAAAAKAAASAPVAAAPASASAASAHASSIPHAKITAPPPLSSAQSHALRARLANRRQAAAQAQAVPLAPQPGAGAAPQKSAAAASRAAMLEQADNFLDSAPAAPRAPSFR